jgi:hypothetical protein
MISILTAKKKNNVMSFKLFKCSLVAVAMLGLNSTNSLAGESTNYTAYFTAYPTSTFDPCREMIVEIDGVRLVKGKGKFGLSTANLLKTETQNFNDCNQLFIPDVYSIDLMQYTIAKADLAVKGLLAANEEAINKQVIDAHKQKKTKILSNGVAPIVLHGVSYFILPLNKSPTKNNVPVVLRCNSYCTTSYIHPSGLWLHYNVPRIGYPTYPDEKVLQLDQEQRAILEAMINKAQSVNINGKMGK